MAAAEASEATPAPAPAAAFEAACVGNENEEDEEDADDEEEDDEGVPADCAEAVRGRERALASTCGSLSVTHIAQNPGNMNHHMQHV